MRTTERLILRPFEESDFEAVHSYGSDPEVTLYTSFGPNTEEATRKFILQTIVEAGVQPRKNYNFAIVLKSENRLIGGCGLCIERLELGEAEIGYVLHRDFWGQGYMPEAARELLTLGFDELNLHRIFARCDVKNPKSARVMEKIGMQREGLLRESERAKQGWADMLLYAILDRDWKRGVG